MCTRVGAGAGANSEPLPPCLCAQAYEGAIAEGVLGGVWFVGPNLGLSMLAETSLPPL